MDTPPQTSNRVRWASLAASALICLEPKGQRAILNAIRALASSPESASLPHAGGISRRILTVSHLWNVHYQWDKNGILIKHLEPSPPLIKPRPPIPVNLPR